MSFDGFANRYLLDRIVRYSDVFVDTVVIDQHTACPDQLLMRQRLDFRTAADKDGLRRRTAEEFFFKKGGSSRWP